MSKQNENKKLTLTALILMIFTSVYGFTNMPRAFFLMGYAAIPWYILSALLFFIPFAFMVSEYGAAFKDEKGGMYSWMEKSVSGRFAFIATFMWYASYIIWMVSVGSGIWVPLSFGIYGEDRTQTWSLFGNLTSVQTLGVLGIIWILFVTAVGSKGVDKISKITNIGGTACALMNVVLLIGGLLVAGKNGKFAQPIGNFAKAFTVSPDVNYQSGIGILSFLTFAIFAYGGLEVVGGLVDKTEDAEKNFPKGVTVSAIIIAVGYAIGIFVIGMFTNWEEVMHQDGIHLGNVAYKTIQNLGYEIGSAFGAKEATCVMLGHTMGRVVGISMFLALTGAFFTLTYSPLKTLIQGAPADLWPGKLGEMDENGMPKHAMWIQAIIVICIMALVSFGGKNANEFFRILTLMVNVAMTLPYLFLAVAFKSFKEKQFRGEISSSFKIYKTQGKATAFSYIVAFVIAFANVFTIIQPAIDSADGWKDSVVMVLGPVLFAVIAMALYGKYQKKAQTVSAR